MKYIELCHRITNGLITFPGMPPVEITPFLTREECGNQFGEKAAALLDQIKMVNISGTYLDAPLHRFEDGYTIADIPLEKLVDIPFITVKIREGRNYFDKDDFKTIEVNGGAVLLYSGHDEKFGTDEYAVNPPYLTPEGAKFLMEKKVVFVGIDSPLIDDMVRSAELGTPVHDIILSEGAIVCEDMTHLQKVYKQNGTLTAVPPAVEMASFTARVFAKIL